MEIPVVTNANLAIQRMPPASVLEGVCYLCGLNAGKTNLTREHLVARTFFKPNRLQNPLLLSACKQCNNTKSQNEERVSTIFRLFTDSAAAKPATKRLLDSANITKSPIYPNNRNPRQHRHIENRQLEPIIANIESSQGLIKKRFLTLGSRITDADVKAIQEFYIDIAKGLITLATQQLYSWDNYSMTCEWSYPYDMSGNQNLFLAFLQPIIESRRFEELWASVEDDPSLEVFATIFPNSSNKIIDSGLVINFYGRHVGVVTLINKASSNYKLKQKHEHKPEG